MTTIAEYMAMYGLTKRECDVGRLLLGGLGDKSIARLLSIELQTEREHMAHILRKTCSPNRTAAALRLVGC